MPHDMVVLLGISTIAFISITILSVHEIILKKRLNALKASGMTNEDREVLQVVLRSIQRIEERLEALETLTMEREREEKFGMKL